MPTINMPVPFSNVSGADINVTWFPQGQTSFRVLVGPVPNNGNYHTGGVINATSDTVPMPAIPTGSWFAITLQWIGGYTSYPYRKT
jgi:hypothetical protein